MRAIWDAVSSLAKQPADPGDYDAFFKQTTSENNPRGAAILLAVNTEVALDSALRSVIELGRADLLFGTEKALGSFRNKIHIAYAFGLFGNQTFGTLETIRYIRNAFAHSQIPLTFDMPEIMNACAVLTLPAFLPPHTVGSNDKDVSDLVGLKRYRESCTRIGHNLSVMNWNGIEWLDSKSIEGLPEIYTYVVARQKPLP
jgi:hypothetical protein